MPLAQRHVDPTFPFHRVNDLAQAARGGHIDRLQSARSTNAIVEQPMRLLECFDCRLNIRVVGRCRSPVQVSHCDHTVAQSQNCFAFGTRFKGPHQALIAPTPRPMIRSRRIFSFIVGAISALTGGKATRKPDAKDLQTLSVLPCMAVGELRGDAALQDPSTRTVFEQTSADFCRLFQIAT